MATTTNPLLSQNQTVYVVTSKNNELKSNGATFFQAVVSAITWNNSSNQYHYELTPISGAKPIWMSENKFQTAVLGDYMSTNQNNARTAFRALVDSLFP